MVRRLISSVETSEVDRFLTTWLAEFGYMTFVRASRAVEFCQLNMMFDLQHVESPSPIFVARQYLIPLCDAPHDAPIRFCAAMVRGSHVYFVKPAA